MPEPVRLSFAGEVNFPDREQQVRLLKGLQGESRDIAGEIANRISISIGVSDSPPQVEIHFFEGSILWSGIIEWARTAWEIVGIMSTVGGAFTFVQIVRSCIDEVLRRRFFHALGGQYWIVPISSRVLIISGNNDFRPAHKIQDRLFGIAALIVSIATLIAAIGLLIRLLQFR